MAELKQLSNTPLRSVTKEKYGLHRRRRIFSLGILLASLAFLVVGAVLAYRISYADRIYPGVTTLDGVNLGSLTRQEAAQLLFERRDAYSTQELHFRYQDKEWAVSFDRLGIRPNAEKVLDSAYAIGRQGNLLQQLGDQLDAVRFGRVVDVSVLVVNEEQAASYISDVAKEIDRPVTNARLVINADFQVNVAPSMPGRKLNTSKVIESVTRTLATLSPETIDLYVEEMSPTVLETDLEPARMSVSKILSSPFTLKFENRTWAVSQQDIANLLILNDSSKLARDKTIGLDEAGLTKVANRLAQEINQEALKPRLEYNGGQLKTIREGKTGYKLDVNATVAAIENQIATDNRAVALPVQVNQPAGMSGDLRAIKEMVSTASTSYGGGLAERMYNVELAASKLNGVVVGPDETFSFNEELGPMTLQAGFKWGWGISQSQGQVVTIPSVAGGICQVSTTLFQPIFWAGYQIEERNWHLYWIDRYGQPPAGLKGLDSTVDQTYDANGKLVSAVDLKFKNTTPYPILIQAKADGSRLTFSLYSTKPNWEVKVDPPKIENVEKADTTIVREVDPSLPPGKEIWVEAAQDGFKSTIIRTVLENGKEPRVLKLMSTYKPSRNVVRVGASKN